jgi:8-oxo-dGTP pyrophosphatase MutT (NUDIX family)
MTADRPASARPSATVVMLRDESRGPELLMVRRRAGEVFGDSYAFPGGLVDANEPTAHEFCRGITREEANRLLQVEDGGLDFYSAAIRELFEETGILLARDAAENWAAESPELRELRVRVDTGELSWADFLHGEGLHMACDALHYFAHWETPLTRPKRWSARFFMAVMPVEQLVRHDGSELTDSRWMTAADALSGEFKLPFPTVRNLRMLAELDSVAALIDWADERARFGVVRIRPVEVVTEGESEFFVPGDPGYPGERAD